MLKAKTLRQLATINSPSKKVYEAVIGFLKSAGVEDKEVSPDGVEEVAYDGILLTIGTDCLYAMNEQGNKIDNLLDKNCKLEVMNKKSTVKVIRKK